MNYVHVLYMVGPLLNAKCMVAGDSSYQPNQLNTFYLLNVVMRHPWVNIGTMYLQQGKMAYIHIIYICSTSKL